MQMVNKDIKTKKVIKLAALDNHATMPLFNVKRSYKDSNSKRAKAGHENPEKAVRGKIGERVSATKVVVPPLRFYGILIKRNVHKYSTLQRCN